MNVLVDIGNTRIKWACEDSEGLSGHRARAYTEDALAELLAGEWRSLARPEQVCIASVAAADTTSALCRHVRSEWNLAPRLAVTEKERAGLRNAYDDVAAMGVDRWLAMVAAWNRYKKPVCVIDCGTAVTVDVILEGGRHAGGFIVPGLRLAATALERETHRIDRHREQYLRAEFGHSTASCINNGFAVALAGLLDRCAGKTREEYGAELQFVITGGGAEPLLPLLSGRMSHRPHLVLEGLSMVYHDADGIPGIKRHGRRQ